MRNIKSIELNDNDIIAIIAEKYNVSEDDVVLSVDSGDPQYSENRVYAYIKLT